MTTQYDNGSDVQGTVVLNTPTEILLKDIMVALKQTRTELCRIATALEQKSDNPELKDGVH